MSKTIGERIAQFAPTTLTFDESLLGERDRQVLAKVVEAASVMEEIFLVCVYSLRHRPGSWQGGPS
jgi:hypothetical protein